MKSIFGPTLAKNILFVYLIIGIYSCSKKTSDTPPVTPPTLSVNKTGVSIEAMTNSKDTFTITASGQWTASCDSSWLSLSVSGGSGKATIIITAATNAFDTSYRKTTIRVSSPGLKTDSIQVTQDPGIIDVAGNRTNGPGLNQFNNPSGIFVDEMQNIYVSDMYNQRVVKWTPGATQGTIVAGDGVVGTNLNHTSFPTAVFVDGSGNVYVGESDNYRVTEWTPGATQGIVVAGNGTFGSDSDQIRQITGIWVDKSKNIYISDYQNSRVAEWKPGAKYGITVAGNGTAGNALDQTGYPEGLFLDDSNNIYVSLAYTSSITKWTPGASQGILVAGGNGQGGGLQQFGYAGPLSVDKNKNVYVADLFNYCIVKWKPGASQGVDVAGKRLKWGTSLLQLNQIRGVFVDSKGYVYTLDQVNQVVTRWAQ